MLRTRQRMTGRRGVTLVELLVVVGMIMMLLAIALPTLKLALEGRRNREASRIVNTFIYARQAEAAESGFPIGVWIERHSNAVQSPTIEDANQSFTLFSAEVPPPYSGDFIGAAADIVGNGTARFSPTQSASLPFLVNNGDQIRFNYKGPYFNIVAVRSTPNIEVDFWHPNVAADPDAPRPPVGSSVPFQIIRRPVKSLAGSIELPKRTAIDLNASGGGALGTEFFASGANDTSPVIIMFNPSGRVERVYSSSLAASGARPSGTIHLMIGSDDESELNNLLDEDNFWISIGHITGSISSQKNFASSMVDEARKFARNAQTMGGS